MQQTHPAATAALPLMSLFVRGSPRPDDIQTHRQISNAGENGDGTDGNLLGVRKENEREGRDACHAVHRPPVVGVNP